MLDPVELNRIVADIVAAADLGVQIGIVIGGGNIFRGEVLARSGINRITGDQMGMLGTVINALALRDSLEKHKKVAKKCIYIIGTLSLIFVTRKNANMKKLGIW